MNTENTLIGVVDTLRLDIYSEPDTGSELICVALYKDEVVIDLENSTEEFYKICTAIGAEGFCYRHLIKTK